MVAEPDGAWTTEERCERVYPETNRVEKKHRVSVLRALRRGLSHLDAAFRTSERR